MACLQGGNPTRVLDCHLSSSLQKLETHLALCSATSRKLIQKYFSNRIQQQVRVRMLPPAPSFPRPTLAGAGLPSSARLWHRGIPPHPPPLRWGCWRGGRRGLDCIPEDVRHLPWYPRRPLSLQRTLGVPSVRMLRGSTRFLVRRRSAGHQLGEVRGSDDQSPVPPFGTEAPRGSAQRRQPHPAGLQRWVWVGCGATPPRTPCARSPRTAG